MERMTGVIFSDLGQASSFMALDWVQDLLNQRLGYHPFPATLNIRPKGTKMPRFGAEYRAITPVRH
jgi:CTP-dependent riboflavin kinase